MKEQTKTAAVSRKSAKQTDFTSGPILKSVVTFGIPLLLGNVFHSLYNVVDTIVVGQFVGSDALAAVGCCFAISMVCIAIFGGFGMACGVISSQTFGAKRFDRMTAVVNTAYLFGLILTVSMIIIGELIAEPVLKALSTPPEIMDMALAYLRTYIAGWTFQFFYLMGSGVLRGMGDSKWPTYALILCAILNVILDLLFVAVFRWNCFGVALATVIAQTISAVAVIIRIYTGGYNVKFERKTFKIDRDVLKSMLRIGIPGMLQSMVTAIGTLIIQKFSNGFGKDLVATNSIAQKVDQFALMPVTSFGTALTMFVGQNTGAGNDKRCNEGMKKITAMIILLSFVVSAFCIVFARILCRAFVSEEIVISMGAEAIRLAALFYAFHALQVSLGSVLQGAGATKPIMYFSFIAIAARVAMCYFFAVNTGKWQGLIWATNGFFFLLAVMYVIYLWKGNWRSYSAVKRAAPQAAEERAE